MTHAPGTFCFAELVSPEVASAKQFYGDLFGWTTDDVTSSSGPYSLFQIDGQVVSGLRGITRGRQRWIPYLAVEHLEPTVAHAERLGARLGDEPFEVSGVARMATIVDPAGRLVGLWEASGRSGVDRQESPGSMWWVEMLAHDVTGATHFYATLFGWTVREAQFSHLQHGYTVYMTGGESVGGAIAIERNWGRVPDRWQVLFAVTDLDRTVAQVHGLGGSDDLPIIDIPNIGRCASLLDHRQGLFIVMQPVAK